MRFGIPRIPSLIVIALLGSALMLLPALDALRSEDWQAVQAFSQSAVVLIVILMTLGLASNVAEHRLTDHSRLLVLVAAYLILPAVFSLPIYLLLPEMSLFQIYSEMLSCFTTTGFAMLGHGPEISQSIHLWRAIVGWGGGLFTLVAVFSILRPIGLGGFEMRESELAAVRQVNISSSGMHGGTLWDVLKVIAPVYSIATALLCLGLLLAGDEAIDALIHAMSTLATSGIIRGEHFASQAGFAGELLIFLFLIFAISGRGFLARNLTAFRRILLNPEIRFALMIIAGFALLLVLRHWLARAPEDLEHEGGAFLRAVWADIFTLASFLSTLGYESTAWEGALEWSGLEVPGMLLLGLCVVGGGVASTAGGIKLLRIYALYQHGLREIERLLIPNSVGGSKGVTRHFRKEGAVMAFGFAMLLLFAVAIFTLLLGLSGLSFEESLASTVAAVSNTGPAVNALGSFDVSTLTTTQYALIDLAMLLGRLEVLVIVAIMMPEFWR